MIKWAFLAFCLAWSAAFAAGTGSTRAETLTVAAAEEGQICPECGYENKPDLSYCIKCGAPLKEEAPGEKIYCPQCGAENPEGAKFCAECGYYLPGKKPNVRRTLMGTGKLGLLFGNGRPLDISGSIGVRIRDNIALSFGLSYEKWSARWERGGWRDVVDVNGSTIPVLFKFKYNFLEGRLSPAAFAEFGYGIAKIKIADTDENENEEKENGFIGGFGGGVDYYLKPNLGFFVEIGWRGQKNRTPYFWFDQDEPGLLNFVQFGGGVIF